jgi:nitrate reductase molybdenum cofactor assembly chaperone NarJ/NarW
MALEMSSDLFRLFAVLLEYPTPALNRQTQECTDQLLSACHPAAELLAGFWQFVEKEPLTRLEEIYTNTFDLQAVCYPYVGHHLFGESFKRSRFMARLNQEYREKGFAIGTELPDHVAVVLRFLALDSEDEFSQVLLYEGLIPTLDKMVQGMSKNGDNPYGQVMRALLLVLHDPNLTGSRSPDRAEMEGIDHA